MASHTSDLQNF